MTKIHLVTWAAWAPGITSPESWRRWARAPFPFEREGKAEIGFVPALQRRRCDALARAMLHVADSCLTDAMRTEVTSVFASRHGGFHNLLSMLEALSADLPLSPARFSHSVHNTPAGLFSIWARNHCASNSVAAGDATFGFGFVEAVAMLKRHPSRGVLLVCGDESVPEPMDRIADTNPGIHALGLVLNADSEGDALEFRIGPSQAQGDPRRAPDSLEFLRWYLGPERSLEICRDPYAWSWTRLGESVPVPSSEDQ